MMRTNQHPTSTPPEDQQPPRKKVRKGTRSCWECKHRKVRCHFVSDGDQSCRECLTRGTPCRSQDLPEPENTRELDRASLSDRLGRVESLLERVLRRLDTMGGAVEAQELPSMATDNDNGSNCSAAATPANETAPALSLFDNGVLRFRRSDVSTPNITLYSATSRDWEKLRHELLDLLPSDTALRRLEQANSCWWLVRMQCFQDNEESLLSSAAAARSGNHPTAIAKVLLWVAICLQQLPRGIDVESLELLCAPTRLIAKCVTLVAQSISSDETLVSSLDGLECLVLLGVLYNNDGKLRSAWLCYRRALNVAQIIGLHRLAPKSTDESESLSRAKHVWSHIIHADRYLSLMLGMYHGITDVALDSMRSGNEAPGPSHMDLLSRIAGSIIERNQRFSGIIPSMVRMTQTIDAELLSISPILVVEDPSILPLGKSIERAQAYAKLMTQLWHYQLIAWLHLPLLLESGTERRYDYSRQSCLEASRHMITCYTSMRRLTANSFCCKSLDFQAFTAAVTLLINMIGPPGRSHFESNDWPAIETVMASLETLAEVQPPDKVATRGLSVLRTLKRVAMRNNIAQSDTSDGLPPMDSQSGRIKLDIPYFGTISIDCSAHSDLPEQQQPTNARSTPTGTDLVATSALSSNVGNTTKADTVHNEVTGEGPWLETHLELGPADIWSVEPDLTAFASFLPDLEDSWDLGL
ncbi:fungal transcription factor regulatory middle homology region [Aspergillus parasiticus SU-1]|uniref:Fungal transcription factor regulatory middle homology region n=1 Tax=Aspergillus parasiticus (strain ATCC 56775 / NRRL 5862 / SRRC 143 / SU-1) TaxID=1403190 RepID=A0A0F0I123_ASPPU|nr:fungal transcription factor regulatory middle homology region [Aspergillus parasiticus SU-1]